MREEMDMDWLIKLVGGVTRERWEQNEQVWSQSLGLVQRKLDQAQRAALQSDEIVRRKAEELVELRQATAASAQEVTRAQLAVNQVKAQLALAEQEIGRLRDDLVLAQGQVRLKDERIAKQRDEINRLMKG